MYQRRLNQDVNEYLYTSDRHSRQVVDLATLALVRFSLSRLNDGFVWFDAGYTP